MEAVDYLHLSAPLDGSSPSGDDPEYDPVFLELDAALRPASPGMVDADAEDEARDWAGLRGRVLELAEGTRDLRLAVRLGRASLMDRLSGDAGLPGFRAALQLAAELTDNLWEHVHPHLDVDDDMDATMRLNAFGDLGDPKLVAELLDVRVASAGRAGVTLRDLEIVTGKREPGADDDASEIAGRVGGVFAAHSDDGFSTVLDDARASADALERIRTSWTSHMEALAGERDEQGLRFDMLPAPQMEALERRLSDIVRLVAERLPEDVAEADAEDEGAAADGPSAGRGAPGVIATRADAERQILTVIAWFRKNEPSSPVPALLERARSMISKSFLEIIDELGEGGISEARRALGGSVEGGDDA